MVKRMAKHSAVILAAGKGVRMKSDLPKVLHRAGGYPLVAHVVRAVKEAGIEDIVMVVGHGREQVEKYFSADNLGFVTQEQQLGTGHALMQAADSINPDSTMLVLAGDIPLIQAATIKALIDYHEEKQAGATVLSACLNNPSGYGRIVRGSGGELLKIVEEKDCSPEEKLIKEINSGIYLFQAGKVFAALSGLQTANAQGEYYLTDVLEILNGQGQIVQVMLTDSSEDIYGVNHRVQLAEVEKVLRRRKNESLMLEGVTIIDPDSTFIDYTVQIGADTVIFPFTIITGDTRIGSRCEIGPSAYINDTVIGDETIVEQSRIKESVIGNLCTIGPFAYLRPGANLADKVKVGDFVEIKNSNIGTNSKIPHLSYVGDAEVGQSVNIGAGTITCNYDGKNKYHTILEDGVFIGSNTNLVAPVSIGKGSITGAGSTITRDVPANCLAVERAVQKVVPDRNKHD